MDRLTDDQLHAISPPLVTLVRALEDIAARDPSPSVSAGFAALAEYFRTPDAI